MNAVNSRYHFINTSISTEIYLLQLNYICRSHDRTGGSSNNKVSADEVTKTTPTYDIVQEYVKSLDEYRNAKHPSDEDVAGIILEIADFLLEFATLGHEAAADVPSNIHPKLLSEDMRTIGVPHVVEDGGHSVLCYPYVLQVIMMMVMMMMMMMIMTYIFCLSKYEDYDYFIDVLDAVSIILLLLLLLSLLL
jgi:hypothetical protein